MPVKIRKKVGYLLIIFFFSLPISVIAKAIIKEPKIILWAWERKENLQFINPETIGVAFLAKTIRIKNDSFRVLPRFQPLLIPRGVWLCAVARIEAKEVNLPLSQRLTEDISREISQLATLDGVVAIQIDFDAGVSERAFYKALLVNVRNRLGESYPLSITALVSWCVHDNWLQQLPVPAVVPMFFRMGPERPSYLRDLQSERIKPICRENIGISIDEPLDNLPSKRHVYVFNPKAWTETEATKIIKELD